MKNKSWLVLMQSLVSGLLMLLPWVFAPGFDGWEIPLVILLIGANCIWRVYAFAGIFPQDPLWGRLDNSPRYMTTLILGYLGYAVLLIATCAVTYELLAGVYWRMAYVVFGSVAFVYVDMRTLVEVIMQSENEDKN